MNEEIVGIDLGTTNSEIALYRNSWPDVLADQRGRVILPSVVGVDEAGELLVGEEARNQYILYPDRTVRSIKRLTLSNSWPICSSILRHEPWSTVRFAARSSPSAMSADAAARIWGRSDKSLGQAMGWRGPLYISWP
jgi:molecular chaperone DnaK (HSP70)